MNRNPEFQRNLWLELTPHRLFGMPLVLGAIFLLVYLLADRSFSNGAVAGMAQTLSGLLAILWGTRLAAESVINEIRDHTWDGQRMSVLSPWELTWGKLFGSTIYPWYGALICLLVYGLTAYEETPGFIGKKIAILAGAALLAQALGLLVSLQAIRKSRSYGRSQATGFFVLGVVIAILILSLALQSSERIDWYGANYAAIDFFGVSLAFFLGWTILGGYRLMRVELQQANLPWVWGAWLLFVAVYVAGFTDTPDSRLDPDSLAGMRYFAGYLVILLFTYGMAFSERKDPVAFQRILQLAATKAWRRVVETLPLWTVSLAMAPLAALLLAVTGLGQGFDAIPTANFVAFVAATLLLLIRDLGMLLFFNLSRTPKRADMLTVLLLALLYGVIPSICNALEYEQLTGLFWPRWDLMPLPMLAGLLAEAALVSWALRKRWQTYQT